MMNDMYKKSLRFAKACPLALKYYGGNFQLFFFQFYFGLEIEINEN